MPSGGFQANIAWLKEYWGDAADNFIIRGTPYNKGRLLRILLTFVFPGLGSMIGTVVGGYGIIDRLVP